jgi:O-antigen/teichoic acid export membrane protein
MDDPKQVAARSVSSSVYNLVASGVTLGLGFLRSVLLARLLLPEEVGLVNTVAMVVLSMIGQLTDFGLSRALIHREEDVEQAAVTHFWLSLAMGGLRALLALLVIPLLQANHDPRVTQAFLVLAGVNLIASLNATPSAMMTRRFDFRRLATLDILSSVMMTLLAPLTAWFGLGFWALVVEQAAGPLSRTIAIWFFFRPWKPQRSLDWSLVRWYFSFGLPIFFSSGLSFLLNQFDDFWAGTVLGYHLGGFYNKAYEYARYPRRVVANPLMDVFFPAYARIRHDRERLSKTFFRVNSLVVRFGFLFAGAFALVAPEFVRIFPGEKWLPMVTTFRLMLLYTLFDPLIVSAGNLATAVGKPQILTRARLAQLIVFVPLVILLARYYPPLVKAVTIALGLPKFPARRIDGIAIAADVMLLLGIVLILRAVRHYVDFSPRRLFGWPLVSLVPAFGVSFYLERVWAFSSDWLSMLVKAGLFTFIYMGLLLLFERKDYLRNLQIVMNLIRRR